jgi:hypothetical protein
VSAAPRRKNQNQNANQNQRRRRPPPNRQQQPDDLWRPVDALAAPEPITPTAEPTALLASLGPPPLQGNAALAGQYLAAVIERSAALANALAASAGLLVDPEE